MTIGPGEVAMWNRTPFITNAYTGPLMDNFPALIESPDIQVGGVGHLVTFRQWGRPVGHVQGQWNARTNSFTEQTEPWGLGAQSKFFDNQDKYAYPNASPERVRVFDIQRCVDVSPATIIPNGVAFELARFDIGEAFVGIVERCLTIISDITAIDDEGFAMFTFGSLNGEDLCKGSVIHPDPAVTEPLTWEWAITTTQLPYASSGVVDENYKTAVDPGQVVGSPIAPLNSDLRYGNRSIWGDKHQYIVAPKHRIRYWVVLRGPTERFRVRVGARLSGYAQLGGHRGSALASVVERIL